MQNDPSYQNLIEMGISPTMAEAAIKKTHSNDVSQLLDWIGDHEGEEVALAEWLKSDTAPVQSLQGQGSNEAQGISHLVNADSNAQVQSLGHSKNVSEKALLMNGNDKQKALRWIEDHKYDVDFEQPMILVGEKESNLTKEQAEARLKELISKARERREKQEAAQALERQKNRMNSGKAMVQNKRITQEMQMKRQVELDKIEKEKEAEYKKRLLLEMKKQRCIKLGIPYVEEDAIKEITKQKAPPKLSKTESITVQMEQVRIGNFAYPQKCKTLYDTVAIYLNNIIKNPEQTKFRKINTTNQAYLNRIVSTFGGAELLQAIGFVPEDNFLVLHNPDIGELSEIVKVLQRYSSQY